MQNAGSQPPSASENSARGSRWPWFLAIACVIIVLVAVLLPHPNSNSPNLAASTAPANGRASVAVGNSPRERSARIPHLHSLAGPAPAAEEIVAGKVSQFGRSRREIVRTIGRRLGKDVPPEVEKFFDAIESGRWEEIKARWDAMSKRSGQYEGSTHARELDDFWPAVLDAYGVAEQAHLWPAQKLLDYGHAVLDSLRPGMVYVGGTDNGRWIPELLNETGDGEQHVIVTQNAFADGRYLEFMSTLYGDRLATLTSEDSQRAFQDYLADAQKRLQHDQQFPDEPKQIRPGEEIKMVDGKVQVSGQIAVMAINEKLLQTLMQKNPDLAFAIQESFPLTGTYADAVPLGPITELRAQDGKDAFTADRAAQSADYWRAITQQLLSDPIASNSAETLNAYSHDAVAAANLLAAHNYNAEAEQAYRLASQIAPYNPEAVAHLSELLTRIGRGDEARQLITEFSRNYPDQLKSVEELRGGITFRATWPKP